MDWITEKQAAEAAKGSELEALKHSLKHHEQGRDADCVELSKALGSEWNKGVFHLGQKLCAICKKFAHCDRCPIGVPYSNGNADFRCCDRRWADAKKAFLALRINPSDANIATFREAEAKVCKYIEGVIEKLEAESKKETPKLRHGDIRLWPISTGKQICIIDLSEPALHCIWEKDDLRNSKNKDTILANSEHIGNISDYFADLKRNSEDLREFEVSGQYDKPNRKTFHSHIANGQIWIHLNTNSSYFTLDQIIEIHQGLGQEIATLIRDEAKK